MIDKVIFAAKIFLTPLQQKSAFDFNDLENNIAYFNLEKIFRNYAFACDDQSEFRKLKIKRYGQNIGPYI